MDFKKTAPPASTDPSVAHATSDWLDEATAKEVHELLDLYYETLRFWVIGRYRDRLPTATILDLYHKWYPSLFLERGLNVPVQQLDYVSLTHFLENYFDDYLVTALLKKKWYRNNEKEQDYLGFSEKTRSVPNPKERERKIAGIIKGIR